MLARLLEELTEQRARVIDGVHPSQEDVASVIFNGNDTTAGVAVTPSAATSVSAFFAAIKCLAEGEAQLPFKLYRRNEDGSRVEARDERAFHLFAGESEPNEDTDGFLFRETGTACAAAWGNFYAEIEPTKSGAETHALYQLDPSLLEVVRQSNRIKYRYDGQATLIPSDRILHVKALSYNGYVGISPMEAFREALALGISAERYASKFFGSGASVAGVIEHPSEQGMSDEAFDRLDSSLAKQKGWRRSHGILILEENAKWKDVGIPPATAELLATRRFQLAEFARIFRVPLHMLMEMDRATDNNIEGQGLEFIKYTLGAWLLRWEQECNRKLLTRAQRRAGFYFKHNVDGFLRGDIKSRWEAHEIALRTGVKTRALVAQQEDLPPIPDEQSPHETLLPVNWMSASALMKDRDVDVNAPKGDGGKQKRMRSLEAEQRARTEHSLIARWRLSDSYSRLFEEVARRIVTARSNEVARETERLAVRGVEAYLLTLEAFWPRLRSRTEAIILPVVLSYMESLAPLLADEMGRSADEFSDSVATLHKEYAAAFAQRETQRTENEIKKLVREGGAEALDVESIQELVQERVAQWRERAPKKIARRESTQAHGAIALALFAAARMPSVYWVRRGDSCPFCNRLHGLRVQTGDTFLLQGDLFQSGVEDVAPMRVKRSIKHPPAHGGCDCGLGLSV